MKQISLILLLVIISFTSFGQSHANQDAEMSRFRKFYNARMDDSIRNMFSESWANMPKEQLWSTGECTDLQKKYGEIKTFIYIGEMDDDPTVKLYKVVTTKKTYATGLSIDKNNKLETFRFDTSSPYINKLLKNSKTPKS
jgi:hypothetical protein